jgi:hypothetical protein
VLINSDSQKEIYQPNRAQIVAILDLILLKKLKIEDIWPIVGEMVGENGETLLSLLIKEDENKLVYTLGLSDILELFPWSVNADSILFITKYLMTQNLIKLEEVPEQIGNQRTPKGNSLFAELQKSGLLLPKHSLIELSKHFNMDVFGSDLALYIAQNIINGTIKIDDKIPTIFYNNTITVGNSDKTLLSYLFNEKSFDLIKYPIDLLKLFFTNDSNCIRLIEEQQEKAELSAWEETLNINRKLIHTVGKVLLPRLITYLYLTGNYDCFAYLTFSQLETVRSLDTKLEVLEKLTSISKYYTKEDITKQIEKFKCDDTKSKKDETAPNKDAYNVIVLDKTQYQNSLKINLEKKELESFHLKSTIKRVVGSKLNTFSNPLHIRFNNSMGRNIFEIKVSSTPEENEQFVYNQVVSFKKYNPNTGKKVAAVEFSSCNQFNEAHDTILKDGALIKKVYTDDGISKPEERLSLLDGIFSLPTSRERLAHAFHLKIKKDGQIRLEINNAILDFTDNRFSTLENNNNNPLSHVTVNFSETDNDLYFIGSKKSVNYIQNEPVNKVEQKLFM